MITTAVLIVSSTGIILHPTQSYMHGYILAVDPIVCCYVPGTIAVDIPVLHHRYTGGVCRTSRLLLLVVVV